MSFFFVKILKARGLGWTFCFFIWWIHFPLPSQVPQNLWPSLHAEEIKLLSECLWSGEPRACVGELEALGNRAYLEEDTALIVNYLYFKGSYYNRMNQFAEAIKVLKQAEALGYHHDGLAYFKVLVSLGATYFENQDYFQSIDYLIRAEDFRDPRIPEFDRAVLMNYLGILYYQEGAYQTAWEYFMQAIFLMQTSPKSLVEARSSAWLQNILSNIGLCHLRLGRPELARLFFTHAYKEARYNWNTDGMGLAMLNQGRAIQMLYPDSSGQPYFEKAYGLMLVNRSPELLATTIATLMEAHMRRGDLERAAEYEVMAKQSLNNNRNLNAVKDVYSALARLHYLNQHYKISVEYFTKANELLDSLTQLDSKNLMQLEATRQKLSRERSERHLSDAQAKTAKESFRITVVFLIMTGAVILILAVMLNRFYTQQQRTSKLLNTVKAQKDELEKLNSALDLSNRHKNYLLGAVAHDIRNLLGNVNQVSDLLLMDIAEDALDYERAGHLLKLMSQSGQLGMHTIQDLLEGVKPDGQLDLEKEPMLPEMLVQEVCGLLSLRAERKLLRIKSTIHYRKSFLADPDKLKRALLNVLDNAIKFSPSRSEIELKVSENKGFLHISVEDEGIGFGPKVGEGVFEPFSPEGRRGTAGESTFGLGLFIVNKLITAHGGQVQIQNKPEGGALVELWIPLQG